MKSLYVDNGERKFMKPLVSVIVPVFNVEDYLERCLDSLIKQSLSDIEILLIDDASLDKSGYICEEYAEKDGRFRVIHHPENRGLSVARNTGIANAQSDYLMFVDSDDWVHVNFCKDAYECAVQYQADIVLFRFKRVGDNNITHIKFYNENNPVNPIQSGYKTRYEAIDLLHNRVVGNAAWDKLYQKEIFNDISYPPGFLYEDIGTTYKAIWKAYRIYYLDKVLYYYCQRTDSITAKKTEKLWRDWYTMRIQQYRDLAEWGYPSEKLEVLLKNIAIGYCIKIKPNNSDENYIFCRKVLLDTNNIPVFFSLKGKIMFSLFKYCRPIFELICLLFNRNVC